MFRVRQAIVVAVITVSASTFLAGHATATSSTFLEMPRTAAATATSTVKPCVFLFKWPKTTITWNYAGKRSFYSNATEAARNWNNANIGITLTPVAANAISDITFRDADANVTLQPTGWPAGREDYRTAYNIIPQAIFAINPRHIDIKLDAAFFNTTSLGKMSEVRTFSAMHEIGHALGLAHSDLCGGLQNSPTPGGGISVMENLPAIHPEWFRTPNTNDLNKLSWILTRFTPSSYDRTELQMLYRLPLT